MKSSYIKLNQIGAGLSLVCLVHCFASLLIIAVPILGFGILEIAPGTDADYWFHVLLFFIGMPVSMLALHNGYRLHGRWQAGTYIVLGCVMLGAAVMIDVEFWHRSLTIMGAAVLALGHIKNLLDCRGASMASESVAD